MRRTLLRALLLVLASLAVGLAVNAVSPRRIPYWRPPVVALRPDEVVSLAEAEQLWREGKTLFFDARAPADYAAGHIALAYNLPAEAFDRFYPRVAGLIAPDIPVVVYCDGEQCDLSHDVMRQLRTLGVTQARVLVNGWTVWQHESLAVHTGDQP